MTQPQVGLVAGASRAAGSALPPRVPLSHRLLQTGEVCQPRPGAAASALASGPEPGSEPTPVSGALCSLPGGQRPLLRSGAPGCLHQPSERPLDSSGWRCPPAQPHLLVATGPIPTKGGGATVLRELWGRGGGRVASRPYVVRSGNLFPLELSGRCAVAPWDFINGWRLCQGFGPSALRVVFSHPAPPCALTPVCRTTTIFSVCSDLSQLGSPVPHSPL